MAGGKEPEQTQSKETADPPEDTVLDPVTRRKRLLFRSQHRGTREMDTILGGFARANLELMNEGELNDYERLLKENDPDIYDWITGRTAVPADHDHSVMRQLMAFKVPPPES